MSRKIYFKNLCLVFVLSAGVCRAQVQLKVTPKGFVLVSADDVRLSPHVYEDYEGSGFYAEEERDACFKANNNRSFALTANEGIITLRKNGYWGCVDLNGKEVIEFQYNGPVKRLGKSDYFYSNQSPGYDPGNFLVFDRSGNIKAQFAAIRPGNEPPYLVAVRNPEDPENLFWGLITATLDTLLDFKYTCTGWDNKNFLFSEKGYLALKNRQGKCGIINSRGEVVMPFEYQYIEDPHFAGNTIMKDSLYGLIDQDLTIIYPVAYEKLETESYNGMSYKLYKNGEWTLLDTSMKLWCSNRFQEIDPGDLYKHPKLPVKENGSFGLFDFEKKAYFISPAYDRISYVYYSGDAWCCRKGKLHTVFNKDLEVLYTIEAREAYPISDSPIVIVAVDNSWQLIDTTGKPVSKPYETILYTSYEMRQYFMVSQNGKWGFIDSHDRAIVPLEYDDLCNPYMTDEGQPMFPCVKENKRYTYDLSGKAIGGEEISEGDKDLCD